MSLDNLVWFERVENGKSDCKLKLTNLGFSRCYSRELGEDDKRQDIEVGLEIIENELNDRTNLIKRKERTEQV